MKRFWQWVVTSYQIVAYSRAAAELSRRGYHKEAKALMLQTKELRGE